MVKKVLIVSSEQGKVIGMAIARVLSLIEAESEVVTHNEALAAFLSGDYSHVIITDYSEKVNKARRRICQLPRHLGISYGTENNPLRFRKARLPGLYSVSVSAAKLYKKIE